VTSATACWRYGVTNRTRITWLQRKGETLWACSGGNKGWAKQHGCVLTTCVTNHAVTSVQWQQPWRRLLWQQ